MYLANGVCCRHYSVFLKLVEFSIVLRVENGPSRTIPEPLYLIDILNLVHSPKRNSRGPFR